MQGEVAGARGACYGGGMAVMGEHLGGVPVPPVLVPDPPVVMVSPLG